MMNCLRRSRGLACTWWHHLDFAVDLKHRGGAADIRTLSCRTLIGMASYSSSASRQKVAGGVR
jgi:hypothetical protein